MNKALLQLILALTLAACGKQEALPSANAVSPAVSAKPTADNTIKDCADCPEMLLIPAGSFQMGSDSDDDSKSSERPVHRVEVKAFYLGKYEITQAEWMAVMGDNPSNFKGHTRPAAPVRWKDTQEFIRRLNTKTGKDYRLPTEAEWEYAARAGSQGVWSFGDDEAQLGKHAWYYDNSGPGPSPVGQLQPNKFGLFDMYGNVWEWVQDCMSSNYYGAPSDGSAWMKGCSSGWSMYGRVLRGGSWESPANYTRAANRYLAIMDNLVGDSFGFRLAKTR